MLPRRSNKSRPALPALTPDPPTVEPLTYTELKSQNNYGQHLLKIERRRHAGVERAFVHALDELQNQINDLRLLYVEAMAQRLTERTK